MTDDQVIEELESTGFCVVFIDESTDWSKLPLLARLLDSAEVSE